MGLGAFLKGAVKGVKGAVKKILPKKDSNSEGGSPAPSPSAPLMNSAFVFIKPHANTRAVQDLVVAKLTSKRVKILSEGDIAAAKIDKDKLIDQHYYAIASKATLLKPDQLPVPEDKFEAKFGIAWKQALADKLVYNAIDACTKLGVDADGLDAKWQAAKQAGNMEKFGGGFYGAKLEGGIFVFNGFFMTMRSAFVAPGASIHYYVVEWDPKDLKWSEFRGDLLGPTDPAQASLSFYLRMGKSTDVVFFHHRRRSRLFAGRSSRSGRRSGCPTSRSRARTACTRPRRPSRASRSAPTGSRRPSPRTRSASVCWRRACRGRPWIPGSWIRR